MPRQATSRPTASADGARPRRTQAERSATTRERLLDATLACLAERGWSGTTTTEVAQRAGVSRGAQLHHFPTRQDLVAAAVEHLAERRIREFGEAARGLPPGSDWISAGLELIWRNFSDPSAYALLELVVAARTDPELHERLQPVVVTLEGRFDALTSTLLGDAAARDPRLRRLRSVTFLLLQGLAVARIVRDDPTEREDVLAFLKQRSKQLLENPRSGAAAPVETP